MQWGDILSGFTINGSGNLSTVVNGFSDGIGFLSFYFLRFIESIKYYVQFVYSAFPSAFLFLLVFIFLFSVLYFPLKKLSSIFR